MHWVSSNNDNSAVFFFMNLNWSRLCYLASRLAAVAGLGRVLGEGLGEVLGKVLGTVLGAVLGTALAKLDRGRCAAAL